MRFFRKYLTTQSALSEDSISPLPLDGAAPATRRGGFPSYRDVSKAMKMSVFLDTAERCALVRPALDSFAPREARILDKPSVVDAALSRDEMEFLVRQFQARANVALPSPAAVPRRISKGRYDQGRTHPPDDSLLCWLSEDASSRPVFGGESPSNLRTLCKLDRPRASMRSTLKRGDSNWTCPHGREK